MIYDRFARYAGILAPPITFLFIAVAILTHPWFSFTENALSDLGALHTENNWIFNTGLILGGILATVFSVYLQGKGKNMAENTGYAIFLASSVFMILIGVFPEDTAPHFTVSVLFYLLGSVAISISGIGFVRSGRKKEGKISVALVLVTLAIALGIEWNGIAIPETIGALAIAAWVYIVIFGVRGNAVLRRKAN